MRTSQAVGLFGWGVLKTSWHSCPECNACRLHLSLKQAAYSDINPKYTYVLLTHFKQNIMFIPLDALSILVN